MTTPKGRPPVLFPLFSAVDTLPGIGAKAQAALTQLNIDRPRDLLLTLPASAQPLPLAPEMQAVWGYGGDMLLKVVTGGADPTQVVAETTTLINEANGK